MRKIVLTIAVLIFSSFSAAEQLWWQSAWPVRVKVTLDEEYTPSQLPGDDVGVVTFYAAGDACVAAGDYSTANAYYTRAGLAGEMARKNPAAARGNFARQAEDYLRRKEYALLEDVLNQWADDIPGDRLTGYLTLLRVKMLGQQGRYVPAVNRAVVLVKANPQSQFAPQLLLAAAEYSIRDSHPARAAGLLEKLLKDYPESPICDEAKKLLNQVGKEKP